ncbi:hypothetical protein CTEN210_18640 [Chaetoceros tenuissimus]|uniref:Uncharacterized protein n=1 Tax=Chaetoceros tenuissimus TaxID=426638 RepID=A0AAD3HGA7_9STRA|nr:hypothetical protein CTEN210_18640 [Chaetoceros tenuissimus]
MENKLRPIYSAIDSCQYSKALKLTLSEPQCHWPITIALRCHCLDRCGKAREACIEIRKLLSVFGNEWEELDERIWLLSLDSSLTTEDDTNKQAKSNTSNAGGKKKGKGKGKKSGGSQAAPAKSSSDKSSSAKMEIDLDILSVLDMPYHERLEYFSTFNEKNISSQFKPSMQPLEVTEETTVATIAISIKSLRLPRTLVKLYSYAIKTLQAFIAANKSSPNMDNLNDQLYALLTEGYLSNLKLIASSVEFTPNSSKLDEKIFNAREKLKCWEDAQFHAMSLVKLTSEGLYQSWMILAIMEHYKSAKALLELLEKDGRDETKDEQEKLSKKLSMLPRLSEMMTMKQISQFSGDGNVFPPSADDVRLYVECLEMQSKFQEAIDFLDRVGDIEKGDTKKQINDEEDVKNHVGSVIQLTQKELLEMKVSLLQQVDRYQEAFEIYSNELLVLLPDQWTYWEGLLHCARLVDKDNLDASIANCQQVLDRVLNEQNEIRAAGKGPKVPLRGPNLISVELAALRLSNDDTGSAKVLTNAIIEYASLYSPLVFCCFQDLRKYIGLLVEKTSVEGKISDELNDILKWAVALREKNDPTVKEVKDGTESLKAKQERKSRLRSYICSVKFCFAIWAAVSDKCTDKSSTKALDEIFISLVPNSKDMINCWKATMDLGSNPKDGGQKESLPGDDLVLLAIQLESHLNRHEDSKTQTVANMKSVALLEYALVHSPYNAYIKIAASKYLFMTGSAIRAYEVFKDMDVKQIQLDSCSYFVMNNLMNAGLYNEVADQAGKIVKIHSTSSKDLATYMPKAFENGNMRRGREMISWQQTRMSPSMQLLEAKSIIMDVAPLVNDNCTGNESLGLLFGLVGNERDAERNEKIIRDSASFFTAPSVLSIAKGDTDDLDVLSDNRDFTVNEFEILQRSDFDFQSTQSIIRSHLHSMLCRLVLAAQVIKPPKKGKIVKVEKSDSLYTRSESLCESIRLTEKCLEKECDINKAQKVLIEATINIIKAFVVIVSGSCLSTDTVQSDDSLATRERYCVEYLENAKLLLVETTKILKDEQGDDIQIASRLLSDNLVTLFAIFQTTASACDQFSWGKRKRDTKPVAGAMANIALEFKNVVAHAKKSFDALIESIAAIEFVGEPLGLLGDEGNDVAEKVMNDMKSYRSEIHKRIMPHLDQITSDMESFEVES